MHRLIAIVFVLFASGSLYAQTLPNLDKVAESTFQRNKNGDRQGNGKIVWMDGTTYEGNMDDGYFSKYGKMTWSTGEIYEGEWKMDMKNGIGKLTWTNGTFYYGEWADDLMHGEGSMTFPDGTVQKGIWEKGEFIKDL